MSKLVYVQLGADGRPIRIYRDKSWRLDPTAVQMTKAEAVGAIREQVYERSRSLMGPGCERCGRTITWTSMEMNEKTPKGSGGEVSLENCEALCRSCHQTGPDAAHKDRRWQTAKLNSEGPHD